MAKYKEQTVSYKDLLLDPNNYRFQDDPNFVPADDKRFADATVQQKAARALREPSLVQLKNSILRNGLLPFEKLLVRPYLNGKYVVVEGNRRLAAIRWIAEDHDAGVTVPESLLPSLEQIPVFVLQEDASDPVFQEAVLGVRHVSGIKQWGGYQRSKLVVSMRDQFKLEPAEIAGRLAMSVVEVNRRYRAFKALQQMLEDEEYSQYARPDMYPIFHEAVAQPTIREWLNWNDETFKFESDTDLEDFYRLVTPMEGEEGLVSPAKVRTYADVRELRRILPNEEAKTALLDPTQSLSEAIAIAKGPELGKTWKRKVAAAIDALTRIGVPELKAFKKEDLGEVEKLRNIAAETLVNYEKLNK